MGILASVGRMTPRLLLVPATLLLAVGACGGSGDATSSPQESPTTAAQGFTGTTCADVVVVAVRGQEQSPDANFGAGTELRLLATELTRRLQSPRDGGSDPTVRLESIDYESDPPADLAAYDDAVATGADRLDARLDRLESACPDSELVVAGFSMGAQVVHDGLHDRDPGTVAAVVMIADPQRDPVAPYDQHSFGTAAPNPGGLGAGPAFGPLRDRTVAFCAAADDVCNHSPGTSRRAVDTVHKHFYEDPDHVAAMVDRIVPLLERRDS